MKFGIIGCGVIAFTHASALKALEPEGCRRYACCDIIPDKADQYARDHGFEKVYYDYHALLADPEVDVVCVCVPSGLHGQVVMDASNAGKAVVCEKPMEITPAKVDQMIEVVRRNGTKVQCIFQRRLMPVAIAARELVRSGALGRICMAEARLNYYRDQAYYNSAGWRGTWELDGGGALMNQGVHGIDLILWMLSDQVERIYGHAATMSRSIPVEDTAAALIRMKSGAVCVIQGATTAYPGFSSTFTIYGDKGTVSFDDQHIIAWEFIDKENAPLRPDLGEAVGGAKNPIDIGIYGHICLLRDIAQAVREDRAPMLPPEEAALAVKVICGIYESSRQGRPVTI